MDNFGNIGDIQYDVLREVGNIGAGNAATALAQMLQTKVDMTVPKVELLDIEKISSILGGEELIVAGIYLTLDGDVQGSVMFLLNQESAHKLVNQLMGCTVNLDADFTEIELSALQEIGNIISGAYLASLSTLTNLKINQSIPYLCIDMAGAILDVPAVEFGTQGDKALFIQTKFGDKESMEGYFFLIPDLKSYDKIMKSLGF